LVALKTGMRGEEKLALRWRDVDVKEAVIRVRRNYTGGAVGKPKNRERRPHPTSSTCFSGVDDPCAVKARRGSSSSRGSRSFLSPTVLFRCQLYPAMVDAENPADRWA
jgi:integrase